MLINPQKQVMMGKRCSKRPLKYPYQMPQGGIDPGETPDLAMWRELKEETGLTQKTCSLLKVSEHWYKYRLPQSIPYHLKGYIGQEQKWFLLLFTGTEADIQVTNSFACPEFSEYKWVNLDEVTQYIVPFKRETYEHVIKEFKSFIEALPLPINEL